MGWRCGRRHETIGNCFKSKFSLLIKKNHFSSEVRKLSMGSWLSAIWSWIIPLAFLGFDFSIYKMEQTVPIQTTWKWGSRGGHVIKCCAHISSCLFVLRVWVCKYLTVVECHRPQYSFKFSGDLWSLVSMNCACLQEFWTPALCFQ